MNKCLAFFMVFGLAACISAQSTAETVNAEMKESPNKSSETIKTEKELNAPQGKNDCDDTNMFSNKDLEDICIDRNSTFVQILFYPTNRAMDFSDIITWNAGAGATQGAFIRVTNYVQAGGEIQNEYFLDNVTTRKYPTDPKETAKYVMNYMPYGAGKSIGWRYGILCFGAEKESVPEAIGMVKPYKHFSSFGIPSFSDPIYKDGIKDFWAIEAHAGSTLSIGISVHPVEIADFILGFFLIDISNDDL